MLQSQVLTCRPELSWTKISDRNLTVCSGQKFPFHGNNPYWPHVVNKEITTQPCKHELTQHRSQASNTINIKDRVRPPSYAYSARRPSAVCKWSGLLTAGAIIIASQTYKASESNNVLTLYSSSPLFETHYRLLGRIVVSIAISSWWLTNTWQNSR